MTQLLTIERMTYGADALAHNDEGKVVFVSGAITGDVVEADIVEDGSSFARAIAKHIVEPSPHRVEAACPYAHICGGCPWASLSYEEQRLAKRANVVDALVRIGHIEQETAEALVRPCEAPGNAWGYRNKVELGFERSGQRAILGMHAAGKKSGQPSVIKVDECPLLSKHHKRLVRSVSGALGYLAGSHGLEIERVGIRVSSATRDLEVALWTNPGAFPRAQAAKVLHDATKATSIVRVLSKGQRKARRVSGVEVLSGRGHWRERIGNSTMLLSAPSFFQVNTAGATRLVQLVHECLDPQADDVAMDLYSGAGTFTLPLAKQVAWVSAVESYGPAVRDLRRNLDAAHLANVDPIGGDAGREFPDDDASIIVVDPPRAGLAPSVIDKLCQQPARAIAYVSCDPATLARDLARFARNGAFAIKDITPVDLFPQTYHCEAVCSLTRS